MGRFVYTSILLTLLLGSCNKGSEVIDVVSPDLSAITFLSVNHEEEVVTRTSTPLNKDFTVWGYKTMSDEQVQRVFQGYHMKYVAGSEGTSTDNTHGYSYIDEARDQDIKYWDFAANEYNFWGYTGGSYDNISNTLTLSGLSQSVTDPDVELFSSLYHRSPVSKEVVRLEFKHPYAKVRVMFYCSDAIDVGDKVEIGASTFGPESPHQIIIGGTLKVKYYQSENKKETYETTSTSTDDCLSFKAVDLTYDTGTASDNAALAVPTEGTDYYYVIPNVYNNDFTLTTTVEGDTKTASVPEAMMHWLPNYTYTYLFKITEAGKKMEFYDVKIDPWKYGGSQDEEWKNW